MNNMNLSNKPLVARSIVALVLFLGISHSEAADKRKYLIDPVTTAINGITIATAEHDILKRLGKPRSIKSGYSEFLEKPSKYLYYNGMEIYIIEGDIYNLSCTGEKCKTDRGVQVGYSKEKVLDTYGPGNPPYTGSDTDALIYPLKGIDSYLTFIFKDGKVVEIKFFVDFT